MACAKDGHADVAALLLDGVDPDFVGDATADGYTALLAACNYGHVEVARLLLDHGALRFFTSPWTDTCWRRRIEGRDCVPHVEIKS